MSQEVQQESPQSQESKPAAAETTNGADEHGSAPSVPSPEPASAAPIEATVEQSGETPVPETWTGELESLESSEWFKSLPEQHRNLVRDGLKSKLGNFERGYQTKFQDMAKQRNHLENEVRVERERIQNMLYGVDDPTKDVRAELARAVQDKANVEARLQAFEHKAEEARVDALITYVETNAKGVYESDEAWGAFVMALESGIERDTAVKMASALVETPPQKDVPDSISMMSNNSNASGSESNQAEDYETVRRRLLAQG